MTQPQVNPAPHRHYFRFGLRTMFVVLTVFSLWLGWNVHQVRQRNEFEAWVKADGGRLIKGKPLRPWKRIPWMWSFLGEETTSGIVLPEIGCSKDDVQRAKSLFPEALIQHGHLID